MQVVDTDAFEWLPTNPPFRLRRLPGVTLADITATLDDHLSCVVAGSLFPWGLSLMPRFALVILLVTARRIRLDRLRLRQVLDFGARVQPGGDMYESHKQFLKRAANYELNPATLRSLARDERLLQTIPGKTLWLDGAAPLGALCAKVVKTL